MIIDGGAVSPESVAAVAAGGEPVELAPSARERMEPAREVVERAVDGDRIVYGITTGFGALASTRIDRSQAEELQINLLRSHAAGVGNPLPDEVVRGMMALRARTLSQGHSGVRPAVVEKILELLSNDILPVVPELGSVGASGDLAPFAHLALPLIGEGEVKVGDRAVASAGVLATRGITTLRLGPKEGLSLLNGTEGMTTMGCLGLVGGMRLVRAADVACALTVESLYGSERPFRPEIHRLRPHPGQIASAERIRGILAGSEIGASHIDDFEHAVQDAYSLRCAPQVHGAAVDTFSHARGVLEIELGSVVDNPIVLPDTDEVISGGNFHGQPLAFVLDFMTIAITELGSISERRTDRILDPERSNGLPPFLSPHAGTHSGYMLAQYTAAAIVAENRVLSHPASVESIPTSGSQEDHVSMGWGAGRKLLTVLDHTVRVIAIEMLCAAQGIEYRDLPPAPVATRFVDLIRSEVPPLTDDRPPGIDIEAISQMITDGAFDDILEEEELL